MFENIKFDAKDVISILAILVTFAVSLYSLTVARRHFNILNQGYLDIDPRIELARDDIQEAIKIGSNAIVKPDAEFQALNYYVVLKMLVTCP